MADPEGFRIETLWFDRAQYTQAAAQRWAREHGYRHGTVQTYAHTWRIPQRSSTSFRDGVRVRWALDDGVVAVAGRARQGAESGPEPDPVEKALTKAWNAVARATKRQVRRLRGRGRAR